MNWSGSTGTRRSEASSWNNRWSGCSSRLTPADRPMWENQAVAYAQQQGVEAFVTLTQDSMSRLPLETSRLADPNFSETLELWAAGNERESGQVAVMTVPPQAPAADGDPSPSAAPELKNLRWSITPATNEAGDAVPLKVSAAGLRAHLATGRVYEPMIANPQWRTDPLLTFMDRVASVPGGELVQWWVTAEVPADAAAGRYEGTLTLMADGVEDREVAVVINVWGFSPARRAADADRLGGAQPPLQQTGHRQRGAREKVPPPGRGHDAQGLSPGPRRHLLGRAAGPLGRRASAGADRRGPAGDLPGLRGRQRPERDPAPPGT